MEQVAEMITDEELRSKHLYGTKVFQFATYYDELDFSQEKMISWHWHREFQFSVAMAGSVECCVDMEQYTLYPGDGLFINSNMLHQYTVKSGKLNSVMFSYEFLTPLDSILYQKYVLPVIESTLKGIVFRRHDSAFCSVHDSLKTIFKLERDQTYMREYALHNAVLNLWGAFFLTIRKQLEASGIGYKPDRARHERMQKMLEFIHREYHKDITLNDVANAGNISKTEAVRCFNKSIRTTPQRYLTEYRVKQAKELLDNSPYSVDTIAWKTGFHSAGYFCRIFKENAALTPMAYRKRGRANV